MDLVLIKEGTDEWNTMWSMIETHPINEGLEEPKAALNQGEAWQYMSTYRQGEKYLSEFRHRCHPRTNKIEKIVFEHKEPIKSESISKVIKVR
jgi:hypothetical protein